MVTNALLLSLLMWIGSHTSYDVSKVNVPKVELHTKEEIQDIYYGNCKKDVSNEILAVYLNNTVFLNKNIDIRKQKDKAILVHELTHHLQSTNVNQAPTTYEGQEKEAIALENAWRKSHGLVEAERLVRSSAPSCAG